MFLSVEWTLCRNGDTVSLRDLGSILTQGHILISPNTFQPLYHIVLAQENSKISLKKWCRNQKLWCTSAVWNRNWNSMQEETSRPPPRLHSLRCHSYHHSAKHWGLKELPVHWEVLWLVHWDRYTTKHVRRWGFMARDRLSRLFQFQSVYFC